jgi:hypothetical protein
MAGTQRKYIEKGKKAAGCIFCQSQTSDFLTEMFLLAQLGIYEQNSSETYMI